MKERNRKRTSQKSMCAIFSPQGISKDIPLPNANKTI